MIEKKVANLKLEVMVYSANKFMGMNDKIRELVEKNYDMNRAGFYAYGEYLNYFRQNLLKRIFLSDQLNVASLARGFGFATPPRVKDGKFLTQQGRKQQKQENAYMQ